MARQSRVERWLVFGDRTPCRLPELDEGAALGPCLQLDGRYARFAGRRSADRPGRPADRRIPGIPGQRGCDGAAAGLIEDMAGYEPSSHQIESRVNCQMVSGASKSASETSDLVSSLGGASIFISFGADNCGTF